MKKRIALLLTIFFILGGQAGFVQAAVASSPDDARINPFYQEDLLRGLRLQSMLHADLQPDLREQGQTDPEGQPEINAQMEATRLDKEAGLTYLVQFKADASRSSIAAILQGETWSLIGSSETRLILLTTNDIGGFKKKAADLIDSVEDNLPLQTAMVANDTFYDQQWALDAVNAPEAWNITTGNPAGAENPVYVAVIDSGVDRAHPDLDQVDIRAGRSYLLGGGGDCTFDTSGHGTAVSGIIAAETNNAQGIAGICWNITLVPLQIMYPNGTGFESDLISALYDAADAGCKVINMSLGGSVYSDAVNEAIQYAYNTGCLIVASAGNTRGTDYQYPASYDHVFSVGSIDNTLARSDFSTYNDRVDVCAPGEGIVTTFDDFYKPYSQYVLVDGTSFSAPYVSGIVALAACLKPDLTAGQLELLLSTTCQDLGAADYDPEYGHGLIDAGQMLSILSQEPTVDYQSHIQDIGWQDWVSDGALSGTSGLSKRLEAVRITLDGMAGGIEYRAHVQYAGWQDWAADGALSGTTGRSLRLEAIDIRLSGLAATYYDVYYRVDAENIGWLDWAANGRSAGTAGYSYRLEAIEIRLVFKGDPAPGSADISYINRYGEQPVVRYRVDVQDSGWQGWVSDGALAGTTGLSKRMEAIKIVLGDTSGGIEYCSHVPYAGWQDWVADGALSGTKGRALRLEAIDIRLTGSIAHVYDVYYRVHAAYLGWMGWAKNGQSAGTTGFSRQLEAIEIRLVIKGGAAPGPTENAFFQR